MTTPMASVRADLGHAGHHLAAVLDPQAGSLGRGAALARTRCAARR